MEGGRLEGGERRYTCGGWEAGGRGEKVYLWRVGGWGEKGGKEEIRYTCGGWEAGGRGGEERRYTCSMLDLEFKFKNFLAPIF